MLYRLVAMTDKSKCTSYYVSEQALLGRSGKRSLILLFLQTAYLTSALNVADS